MAIAGSDCTWKYIAYISGLFERAMVPGISPQDMAPLELDPGFSHLFRVRSLGTLEDLFGEISMGSSGS